MSSPASAQAERHRSTRNANRTQRGNPAGFKRGGSLKLGLPDSIVSHADSGLVTCLKNYAARAPDVSLEIRILTPRELERGVLDGSLHLALGAEHRRVNGLKYAALFTEHNYLYC